MATPLVTLEQVQGWVFSSEPENEALLDEISALATGLVLEYVGADPVTLLPRDWTEATVPDPVRAAILVTVAHLWRHRGDEPATDAASALLGQLTPQATAYLQRYREQVVS